MADNDRRGEFFAVDEGGREGGTFKVGRANYESYWFIGVGGVYVPNSVALFP